MIAVAVGGERRDDRLPVFSGGALDGAIARPDAEVKSVPLALLLVMGVALLLVTTRGWKDAGPERVGSV